jgi:HEPN domain-containing protein
VEVNNGNYSRTCLFQVMGENNWVIHGSQQSAVCAARELYSEFGKFGSCESFTMAGGSKRGAEEMEAAPAAAPASRAPAELGVRELFMELSGKNDGIDRIRADLQESLKQQSEQLARCMERMRRDQEAGDSWNNWQKGINLQLDLFEDAGRFLKRAEDIISRVRLAMPKASAREALLEGKKIGLDDFEPIGLKVFPGIKELVSDLGSASSLLAKRSLELTVVRNAPSAKVGYRTLDIMANAGSLSPGADKALKEAIRVVEQEEREAKAKPGSQGMPYPGWKGEGEEGNEGACNACGEYGLWVRDCMFMRTGW